MNGRPIQTHNQKVEFSSISITCKTNIQLRKTTATQTKLDLTAHIILVEDKEIIRNKLLHYFVKRNFSAEGARDGQD